MGARLIKVLMLFYAGAWLGCCSRRRYVPVCLDFIVEDRVPMKNSK
jgi:hypothetical protein